MAIRLLALVLLVTACSRNVPSTVTSQPLAQALRNHLVVVESNYESGMLEIVDLTSAEKPRQFPIHSDAVARAPRGSDSIFVINRYKADSLLTLGASDLKKGASYSVVAETNPQDLLWISPGLAILSRLNSPDLLFLNPLTGEETGKISLANLADSDGIPEMAWMARDGEKVAIALQNLNKLVPEVGPDKQIIPAKVAVYDLASKTIKAHTLAHANPITEFKQGPNGEWYLGEAGFTGWVSKIDGGIERLAATTFEPQGLIVKEENLGGDVVDFEILADNLGIAIVAIHTADSETNQLVSFDPSNGKKLQVLQKGAGAQFHQLLLDRPRGLFYMADRHATEFGIRVFSTTTLLEDKAAKRSLQLPPYHLSWMD